MPTESNVDKKKHKNNEKTVLCPIDGCDKEVLSRALHLHVMRSTKNGHGVADEIPKEVDLDEAEEIGSKEVEMEYPENREPEKVARLCPYCERPYRGKHGVMIHLGQVEGRKDHPKDATERHEPDDFAIVEVDDNENIIKIVEEAEPLPTTERRKEDDSTPDKGEIRKHIEDLREQGLEEEANKAEKMLLGE